MTAIALLWSTKRNIQASEMVRALQQERGPDAPAAPGRINLLLWDGAERIVQATGTDPAPGNWTLVLGAWTPDLEASANAAANNSGELALAVAGNVRNAHYLLQELAPGDAQTDAHVGLSPLLGLLARKGTPALQQLSGEWALALFSRPDRRVTLCCDRVGSEALYYHDSPDRFAAATSPAQALALAGLPSRMDPEWTLACLASGRRILPENGATAYAGLKRLRPGCVLQVDARQGSLQAELLRFSLLETFVDLPVDGARLGHNAHSAAFLRLPASGKLGIAWTGGPGSLAVAEMAATLLGAENVTLFALEQSAPAPAASATPEAVAQALGIPLVHAPWPEHAELELRRAALVRSAGLPQPDPFPVLEMDLLCEAMRDHGFSSAWAGCGARGLLGLSADLAAQAMFALARRRRVLPALLLRRALARPGRSLGETLADQLGFLLHALVPRPYRSTQEQARIELLAHHASGLNSARVMEFYKQSFNWREFSSLRRMQLQELTHGDGPARLSSLRLAARQHGVDLALPLLDQHLARYLRLPLSQKLAHGQESPLLRNALCRPELATLQTAAHATVERLAALPPRDDQALEHSPLLRSLFPNLPALQADLLQCRDDDRFKALPGLLDALVEWERECGVEV